MCKGAVLGHVHAFSKRMCKRYKSATASCQFTLHMPEERSEEESRSRGVLRVATSRA